jgi:hypothetical protein
MKLAVLTAFHMLRLAKMTIGFQIKLMTVAAEPDK